MSKNSFKAKNGLTVVPVDPATIVNPEAGDIIADSTDSNKIKQYNPAASMFEELGGGAGGINYLTNPDAETGTTGWVTYADVAQVQPVDGVGGTPAITLTATTVSPLRGLRSFLLSKGALNEQGEGTSVPFTIDPADRASILRVSFDYSSTTNYLDGDVRVYVYDITNSRLIEVVDRDVRANAQGKYVGTFQSSPDSVSYRLILHVASTNALAWDLEFDNVIVGPREIVRGPVMIDGQPYTPACSWTTNTTVSGHWRRVGDQLEAYVRVTLAGAPNAAALSVGLPAGLVIDETKLATFAYGDVGSATAIDVSAGNTGYSLKAFRFATQNTISIVSDSAGGPAQQQVTNTAPFAFASGDNVQIKFSVPILGWSSNATLSEDVGNREIVLRALKTTAQTGLAANTDTVVTFQSVLRDTSASYNTSTNTYVVPETGDYDISFKSTVQATFNGGSFIRARILVNSTLIEETYEYPPTGTPDSQVQLTTTLQLTKGSTLQFTCGSSIAHAILGGGSAISPFLNIAKRSSPQTIAASEVVACRYLSDAAQSIPSGADTTVIYEDRVYDTHSAYNPSTGIFTAPQSGYYNFEAGVLYAQQTWTVNTFIFLGVDFIGVGTSGMSYIVIDGTAAGFRGNNGSNTRFMPKGTQARIIASHSKSPSAAFHNSQNFNYLNITKVG